MLITSIFSFSPQCFQKPYVLGSLKVGIMWYENFLFFVQNDPDCTWYRPRRVLVLESNMWSLERYLRDQERYRQYTEGMWTICTELCSCKSSNSFTNEIMFKKKTCGKWRKWCLAACSPSSSMFRKGNFVRF